MGILSAMLSRFNDAAGASAINDALSAAPKAQAGEYLTDRQISAIRDVSAALKSQQEQYGHVDLPDAQAAAIHSAAAQVSPSTPWRGYWDHNGKYVD